MENKLDEVAKGDREWTEPCQQCLDAIEKESKELAPQRISIPIDDDHTYMVAKYGPVIKYTHGDKTEFKKVRENIDIDRLRRGEYCLGELLAPKASGGRDIGVHKGSRVILKSGKFGVYIEWNSMKKSIKTNKSIETLILEDVVPILQQPSSSIIRTIDSNTSIRTGQYGDYVFHKLPKAKKPVFIKLAPFVRMHGKEAYKTCTLESLTTWLVSDKRYARG